MGHAQSPLAAANAQIGRGRDRLSEPLPVPG